MPDADEPVERALVALKAAIQDRVRAEQLIDRLTGLSNDEALAEWLRAKIDDGDDFWIAFIEVDRFKNINDQHGYQAADELLKRLAEQLLHACRNNFGDSPTTPFRAHGDEFYLAGALPPATVDVEAALEGLRQSIALLRVRHQGAAVMSCTVSIGWLTAEQARESERQNERAIRGALEQAVAHAKRSRDCVVCWDVAMEKVETAEGRADCGTCGSKFVLHVPLDARREGRLTCPNCNAEVERPAGLAPG